MSEGRKTLSRAQKNKLINLALKARKSAYCPYSHYAYRPRR